MIRIPKVPRIPKMGNVIKNLGIDAIPDQKFFNDFVTSKPHTAEFLDRIDQSFADPAIAKELGSLSPRVFTGDETLIKDLYSKTQSRLKANELEGRFQSSLGATDGEKVTGIKNTLKQSLRYIEENSNQGYKQFEQGILKEVHNYGFKTKQAFDMASKSPKQFEKAYGISQRKLMANMLDDTKIGIEELDNVAKIIRSADDAFIKGLQQQGTYIGKYDNYFMPFSIPEDSVSILGEDAVKGLLLKHTKLEADSVDDILANFGGFKDFGSKGAATGDFQMRKADFKSGEDAIEFYSQMNQLDFKDNLLMHYFFHKQRTLRKATIINELGVDPVNTIRNAVSKIKKQFNDKKVARRLETAATDFEMRLEVLNGKKFIDGKLAYSLSTALNMSMSFLTRTPGRSTVRNLVMDYEGNALRYGNSLYNGDFTMGKSVVRIVNSLKYMMAQAFPGKGGVKKEAIERVLDIANFANSADSITMTNMNMFEDILDTTTKASIRKLGTKDGAAEAVDAFNQKLSKGMDAAYRLSGNHALTDMARARKIMSIQQMFTNVIEQESYKSWLESLKPRELQEANWMLNKFGFDENMFNFLKKSSKTKVDIPNKDLKGLGFKNVPPFISKEGIMETSDDIANQFKKKTETAKAFKERISRNWQRFIYNSVNASIPISNIADSVTVPVLYNTPSWLALTLRPMLKFADPAATQFQGLADRIALAVYGNTEKYIGFDASIGQWGKSIARYGGYTAAFLWMKDLLNNRAPTDFRKPDNAIKLAALSGFGGYQMMVASSVAGIFGGRGTGSSLESTPAFRAYDVAKNLTKAAKEGSVGKAARTLHGANPFTGLWYGSGLVDYSINNTLLDRSEKDELYFNMEKYGKPYLF